MENGDIILVFPLGSCANSFYAKVSYAARMVSSIFLVFAGSPEEPAVSSCDFSSCNKISVGVVVLFFVPVFFLSTPDFQTPKASKATQHTAHTGIRILIKRIREGFELCCDNFIDRVLLDGFDEFAQL